MTFSFLLIGSLNNTSRVFQPTSPTVSPITVDESLAMSSSVLWACFLLHQGTRSHRSKNSFHNVGQSIPYGPSPAPRPCLQPTTLNCFAPLLAAPGTLVYDIGGVRPLSKRLVTDMYQEATVLIGNPHASAYTSAAILQDQIDHAMRRVSKPNSSQCPTAITQPGVGVGDLLLLLGPAVCAAADDPLDHTVVHHFDASEGVHKFEATTLQLVRFFDNRDVGVFGFPDDGDNRDLVSVTTVHPWDEGVHQRAVIIKLDLHRTPGKLSISFPRVIRHGPALFGPLNNKRNKVWDSADHPKRVRRGIRAAAK